jgi:hypothetical protein
MSTTVTRSNSSTMTVQLPTSQSLLEPLLHSLKVSDPPLATKAGAEHVEDVHAPENSHTAGSNDPSRNLDTSDE